MKKIVWMLLGAFGAGSMAVAGCGGSESNDSPLDAASDTTVTDASVKDSPADNAVECVDASLSNLSIPDAAVGDGGQNTVVCANCLRAKCSSQVTACDKDCVCRNAAVGFIDCVSTAANPTDCASVVIAAPANLQAVATCGLAQCQKECVPAGLLDGSVDAKND